MISVVCGVLGLCSFTGCWPAGRVSALQAGRWQLNAEGIKQLPLMNTAYMTFLCKLHVWWVKIIKVAFNTFLIWGRSKKVIFDCFMKIRSMHYFSYFPDIWLKDLSWIICKTIYPNDLWSLISLFVQLTPLKSPSFKNRDFIMSSHVCLWYFVSWNLIW